MTFRHHIQKNQVMALAYINDSNEIDDNIRGKTMNENATLDENVLQQA
jgi:hypothetical protein